MKKFFKKKEPTADELRDSLEAEGIITGRMSSKPRPAKFSQYSDYAKQLAAGGRNDHGPRKGAALNASGNPYANMNQTNNMASNPYASLKQDPYSGADQSAYGSSNGQANGNVATGYSNSPSNSNGNVYGNSTNSSLNHSNNSSDSYGSNNGRNNGHASPSAGSNVPSGYSTPTHPANSPYAAVESSYSTRFGSSLTPTQTTESLQEKKEELFQGVDRSKLRNARIPTELGAPSEPRTNTALYGSSNYHPRNGSQTLKSGAPSDTQQDNFGGDDDLTGATPIPPPIDGTSYASEQVQEYKEIDSEEEDVDAVKQELRFTKQESVAASRNALRLAEEAEESGRNTLGMLGSQSERFSNVEQNISLATTQNKIAEEKAKELKTLNRSMFAIHVGNPFNSKRRLQEQEDKIRMDRALNKEEAEHRRQIQYQSQQRVQNALGDFGSSHAVSETERKYRTKTSLKERSRYQFEADEEDDALENELDANLDALGDVAGRLRKLAVATGEEVQRQNERLNIISDSTDNLDINVHLNTTRLANIR